MHKGMISGLTASAIKTQTFVNTNGGLSFNSPIFKRAFNISSSGGLTITTSSSSVAHTISGTISGILNTSGKIELSGNSGVYLGSSNTFHIGDTGVWGSINFAARIITYTDIRIGNGSASNVGGLVSTIIAGDGTTNVLCIRNQTTAQSFRVYRTTNVTSGNYVAPTDFERVELTWNTTGNFEAVIRTISGGTGSARGLILRTNDIDRITVAASGDITIADGLAVNVGSTSGTQFGTSSGQKIGFWGASPVIRPATVTAPAGGTTVDSECRASLSDLITKLKAIGLIS